MGSSDHMTGHMTSARWACSSGDVGMAGTRTYYVLFLHTRNMTDIVYRNIMMQLQGPLFIHSVISCGSTYAVAVSI